MKILIQTKKNECFLSFKSDWNALKWRKNTAEKENLSPEKENLDD